MADNVIVRVPEQQFIRGEDGYSPVVTVDEITHGHSVTITDRDHPNGQNFNVLDGDSAYEQAVAGGYTGTEAQFNEELASFKELSDEAKEAAPFYAEYGVTTKAEIVAAINGKRQIYVHSALGMDYAPLVGTFIYTPMFGSELQTGYRFAIVEGTTQYIYDLADEWSSSTNDLTAPAQRAETAAAQALIRMNSADASAQAAAETATTFTEQTAPAAVNAINETKADALTAVGNAQTTAVGAVQQESTTQQAAIQQKGDDVLESIPSDYTDLTEDVADLKSAITVTKTGVPADFTNNYLAYGGSESPSTKLALSKRWFNYQQDKLISVETTAPYGIYAYGFKRQKYLGPLREDGTCSTSGPSPVLYADKINLSDYADITFKFGLRHNEDGTSLDVSTSEVVNIKFTYELDKDLARRKISVMGDSISSFTGYTSPGSPDAYYPLPVARMYYLENMYWKTLADRNDMDVEVIDAYAGSTVADKWQDAARVPFYDDSRINRLGNPDVIIVEGGINDFGGNPLGDYPALGDYSKTYEFRTGYSLLLNKLKNTYKNATIVCLSMTSPRTYNNTTFPEKQTEVIQALATDTTPHAFAEFNESIEHIAKQYQCAYCDITDLLNYYLSPTSSLGPHWYFNLHLDVAYRIEQKLKEIFA